MKKQGRGFVWTEEEEKKLINIYNKRTVDDLVVIFKRSKTAILKKANKLGLVRDKASPRSYNKIWTEEDEQYLKNNYAFGNLNIVAKRLNRTKKAITERAKVLKLKRDAETTRILSCKYSVNSNFFAEWSPSMSYVLGLFCADGNLKKDSNTLSISLHVDDRHLIEKILDALNSNHKVLLPKNKNMAALSIDNIHMYNDLVKLGMVPNKSKTIKCPDVPDRFIPDFIRGVMDGDGSVDSKRKRMKIVSASKDFIDGLAKMFNKIGVGYKLYNEHYIYNNKKSDFYVIRVLRVKDIKILYNLMYAGSNLYLKRKKQAFIGMGVENENFIIKCKSRMRPVVATNNKEKLKFSSVKEAKNRGFPRVAMALKGGKKYKGYTWKYLK